MGSMADEFNELTQRRLRAPAAGAAIGPRPPEGIAMPASLRIALGAGCIVAVMAAAVSAQVYTWKDAKGVTHYSDSPPANANQKVRTVDVPPAPPAQPRPTPAAVAAPAATVARAPAPPVPDPAAQKAAAEQRAAACKQATDNLAVLKTNAAVAMDKDGDGKNDAVLNAEERNQQTASMEAAVTANCAPAP
jgi:hypothetical protein